mmetsp:Transcript_10077/g.19488  ORF Transcript_10077/g.19488 Transcript_10077/m.19488 type:complete len:87 (-) Transcript_10077:52-312(-)
MQTEKTIRQSKNDRNVFSQLYASFLDSFRALEGSFVTRKKKGRTEKESSGHPFASKHLARNEEEGEKMSSISPPPPKSDRPVKRPN